MNCIRLSRLLAVIIVCLLVIGAVSGTIVRHIVQLIPIFAALCLALAGRKGAASAALPLFSFWFLIMVLVLLTATGIANVAPGTYSPTEIAMASLIWIACGLGGCRVLWMRSESSLGIRVGLFLSFGMLQILLFRVSFIRQLAQD